MDHTTIQCKTNGLTVDNTKIQGFIQTEQETVVIAI